MDSYETLLKNIDWLLDTATPLNIPPLVLAGMINDYEEAVDRLLTNNVEKTRCLEYIYKYSRGKARVWAGQALAGKKISGVE